jgi:hypothetical protein
MRADTGDTNEVVPLADKSCTLSIIQRVVKYLQKHAEFEAAQTEDEVAPHLRPSPLPPRALNCHTMCAFHRSVWTRGNSFPLVPSIREDKTG